MRARAQTTVEVAVVFPLLVLLMLALVQFAIYFHARNVVTAAVQEAAHTTAAVGGSREAGQDRANELLRAGLGPALRERVSVSVSPPGTDTVHARATGSYQTFLRITLPLDVEAKVSRERFRAPR